MGDDQMSELDTEELPPRRRRAGVTPAMAILAAVLVAAIGFIGGVQVQKARGDSGGGTAAAATFPRGAAAAGGGESQAAQFTAGTVQSKRGSTLYVETQDG